MKKPKGKTPSLLSKSNGKPILHKFSRKVLCQRCKSNILANHDCFIIPTGLAFSIKKAFCHKCFGDILQQTKAEIDTLEETLRSLKGNNDI